MTNPWLAAVCVILSAWKVFEIIRASIVWMVTPKPKMIPVDLRSYHFFERETSKLVEIMMQASIDGRTEDALRYCQQANISNQRALEELFKLPKAL